MSDPRKHESRHGPTDEDLREGLIDPDEIDFEQDLQMICRIWASEGRPGGDEITSPSSKRGAVRIPQEGDGPLDMDHEIEAARQALRWKRPLAWEHVANVLAYLQDLIVPRHVIDSAEVVFMSTECNAGKIRSPLSEVLEHAGAPVCDCNSITCLELSGLHADHPAPDSEADGE